MKLSTNGYSYDGPPYDAGSADPLGKLEIKEDGIYRLQMRDLFGGTRDRTRTTSTGSSCGRRRRTSRSSPGRCT